jgi:hypothetical protein
MQIYMYIHTAETSDDDDVYLDKLQTRGVKENVHVKRRLQPIRHK